MSLLQREVRRVLATHQWSYQRAEIQTGIPASTIQRMAKGLAVKAPTIIQFGEKVGEPVRRWELVALGRDPDAETGEAEAVAVPSPLVSPEAAEILEYIEDPETRQAVKYFHGVPEELRSIALDTLKAFGMKPRYKNAGEIARAMEEEATVGKRASRNDAGSRAGLDTDAPPG